MNLRQKLIDLISRHAPSNGFHPTPLTGVTLVRSDTPTVPMPLVYEPTLCYIVQGRKQVLVGTTAYVYDAANYLVASVDIPVMGSVIEASEAEPYLCLVLDLDMAVLSELALRNPPTNREKVAPVSTGIGLNGSTPELLDAVTRLAGLLDTHKTPPNWLRWWCVRCSIACSPDVAMTCSGKWPRPTAVSARSPRRLPGCAPTTRKRCALTILPTSRA